jgi:hypothetical protein
MRTSIGFHLSLAVFTTAWVVSSPPLLADERVQVTAPFLKVSTENQNPFKPSVNSDGTVPTPRLLKVPLSPSRALQVSVKLSKECYLGDMEAILLESGWSRDTNVRISLESLVPKDPFVATTLVSVTMLQSSSAKVSFTLPPTQQSTPMGIFICKDTGASGRCSDKEFERFDDLFARYNPLKHPETLDPTDDIKDKSYFFGHVVAYSDSVGLTSGDFTEEANKVIEQDITHLSPEQRVAALSKIQALHKTLGSLPLTADDTGVQITLPSMATEGCDAAPKK